MTRRPATPATAAVSLGRLVLVAVAAGAILALAAMAADAHAYVEESTPPDGSVLDAAPAQIRVRFDTTVQAPVAAIRVWNSESERVDADDARIDPADERAVVATLRQGLPDGPYVVTWRAVSFDGHVILGSFDFTIGAPTGAVPANVTVASTPASVSVFALFARALVLGGVLVCAGVGLFHLATIRHRDRRWRATQQRLIRVVNVAAQVAVVSSVVSLPIHAIETSGAGIAAALFGDPFLEVVIEPFGIAALARVFALLPFAVGVRTRSPVAVSMLWLAAVGTLAIDGHSITQDPVLMMFTADLVHTAAAALWLGGLVGLAVVLRTAPRDDDPQGVASVARTFSDLAALAVVAVAASGVVSASVTAGPVTEIPGTAYGRVLVTKTALVAAILGMAAWNRWRLVPRVTGNSSSRPRAVERLRRAIRVELGLLFGVVAATAVLVVQAPARPMPSLVADLTPTGIVAAAAPTMTTADVMRTGLLVVGVAALISHGWRLARTRRHDDNSTRPAPPRPAAATAAAQLTWTPPQNAT